MARNDTAGNVYLDSLVGDGPATDAAFADAAHIVRFSTWVQRICGVPMEPRAAIGTYENGRYTLHAGAGGAVRPRNDLAAVLGVPQADVRMVMHDVGGNFGTRGAFNPEFALVVWAARRIGRPVKWTCTAGGLPLRLSGARPRGRCGTGARRGWQFSRTCAATTIGNVGAYPISSVRLQKGVEIMSSLYHVPAVHVRARGGVTNTAPTRPIAAPAGPRCMYVMERLIDLAAGNTGSIASSCAGATWSQAAMPYRNPFGMVYDSGDYHGVMESGAASSATGMDFPRARRRRKARTDAAASALPTTSTPRPACRGSAPR